MTTLIDIPPGTVLWVIPPRIEALITGVKRAMIDEYGMTTIVYEDGTSEAARVALPDDLETIDFFRAVGDVQATRTGRTEKRKGGRKWDEKYIVCR